MSQSPIATFRSRWIAESPVYNAWGKFVVDSIAKKVGGSGLNVDDFFKIPPKHRLKTEDSLIEKAFYRQGKEYQSPFEDIEDKVGVRFVVLLTTHVEIIQSLVEDSLDWNCDVCRDFSTERLRDPLLFTYQSVHIVVRPNTPFEYDGVPISTDIPCEIQIRTLLQHAHAELTHDEIYKSRNEVNPTVIRTVAKCMALIETTDEYFLVAKKNLEIPSLQQYDVQNRLDDLYEKTTGYRPDLHKSSLTIWSSYKAQITGGLVEKIEKYVDRSQADLKSIITINRHESSLYKQSIVLFVCWLIQERSMIVQNLWPLPFTLLEDLASNIGTGLREQ